jgi:glycine/D-amino acid oxidase-like deaminating enzyme
MHEYADVIVIGAGTTGTSAAWHLARAGVSVRLLDKGAIASGSSGASPGIVRAYYADLALSHLAAQGVRAYRDWQQHYPGACGYQRTGFLTGIPVRAQAAAQANVAHLQAAGAALEWLCTEQMRERVPDLYTDGLAGAVYEPDAGYCDPRLTARSFAAGASAMGAVIEEGRAARRIVRQAGRVIGVQTDSGFIASGRVINAAGPWAAALAAECSAPLPIHATRHCVGIVEVCGTDQPMPGYCDRDAGFYLRPDSPGIYFIGALSGAEGVPIDPDAFDRTFSDTQVLAYRDRAAQRLTRLLGAQPIGRRVSFFDDTPDGNPLLGPDPRAPGLMVAAGLSGHGFKFAPLFGQAIAQWVLTGEMPAAMAPFAPQRFID